MNEKIRELAEQAGLRFTQLMSNPMVPVVDGKETDLEKFAELIVKECVDITDDLFNRNTDGTWTSNELYTDYNGALFEVKRRIEEHFGLNRYTQEELDEAHHRGVELTRCLSVV